MLASIPLDFQFTAEIHLQAIPWTPHRIHRELKGQHFKNGPVPLKGRFGKPAEDGRTYVDAVFEGGGVKGFAFLGALQVFHEHGIFFRKVAGTSAGRLLLRWQFLTS